MKRTCRYCRTFQTAAICTNCGAPHATGDVDQTIELRTAALRINLGLMSRHQAYDFMVCADGSKVPLPGRESRTITEALEKIAPKNNWPGLNGYLRRLFIKDGEV